MGQILRDGVAYGGSNSINFAPLYSSFATYAVGDYAVIDGLLRKCITAVTVPETFDPTKWTIVNVASELEKKANTTDLPAAVTVTNTGDVYIGTQLIRKVLTQDEYDLLTTYDPKVDYLIIPAST